ncbi:MAG: phenylalanine--tRNA ligase subunit alpha, partial [Chloroflexi bacterium]|nr:phenylalanine--tRNA ligase subunit alpha [Chloroflexota bacterium]
MTPPRTPTPERPLLQELENLVQDAEGDLGQVADTAALEAWRVSYLGRRGRLTLLLRGLASLPLEERRDVGAQANRAKELLGQRLSEREQVLQEAGQAKRLAEDRVDVTLPGRSLALGRLHPTTQIVREICAAFVSMGFDVVEGPEVEWDAYNFEKLNIPRDHPARDMWQTLWLDYRDAKGEQTMLLRTHTSPMQARIMERTSPPVRVVVPGKCYRYEATDATHESQFYQVEGLAVDEGITFADLKGTLYEFARRIFGPDRRVRFRCDYFPFVEPGVEMAIDCFACQGKGCRICKESGWIEIMGAGMVHPRVLEGVGYDPDLHT